MKKKWNDLRLILRIFVVTAFITGLYACDDEDVSSPFSLQYMGIENIGTGMNFRATPYYKGITPSQFTIQKIKLNGEETETTGFLIDPETGVVTILPNNTLAPGKYSLTIGCTADGKSFSFPDVLSVNMLAPTPASFKYKEPLVTFEYGYLDTAFVAEISESVSITKFILNNEGDGKYFQINAATGMITLNPENKIDEPFPGLYKPVVGIITPAGTSYYPGIIAFNITSKPLKLAYEPAFMQIEQNMSDTSAIPTLKGSTDQLVYSIKSVNPATEKIKIDSQTGKIVVEQDNGLEINEYKVAVTATNQYGTQDFENVFTCNVIAYIEMISDFSYPATTITRTQGFSIAKADGFKGDYVTFSFDGTQDPRLAELSINAATGEISAPAGNKIPANNQPYEIKVKAHNTKGDVYATLLLTVASHPNEFVLDYGNNLGVAATEANQFRIEGSIPQTFTPVNPAEGVTYTKISNSGSIELDANGNITFKTAAKDASQVYYILIEATKGSGDLAYTQRIPVFFYTLPAKAVHYDIRYAPFVVKVNPKTGGKSSVPEIEGMSAIDRANLRMDYRRTFSYYDFGNKSELSGQLNKAGETAKMLEHLWASCGYGTNLGARAPLSGFDAKLAFEDKLAYVNQSDNQRIYINPNKWIDPDGDYANGIFTGQMTVSTDGKDPQGATSQAFPVILWFSTDF